MEATLVRNYKSQAGNTVFVYSVNGTAEELESYKNAQGKNYRVDEKTGAALWFTTRCIGDTGTLLITSNNKVVPDMSEYDKAASMAAQYGGNLGEQLARAAAEALLAKSKISIKPSVNAPQTASQDLGKL